MTKKGCFNLSMTDDNKKGNCRLQFDNCRRELQTFSEFGQNIKISKDKLVKGGKSIRKMGNNTLSRESTGCNYELEYV